MKTVHIVSHTHWDREWYQTFQQFRLRLVHLVDGLLDLLKNDPNYKFFMLDGQTIALEDYLQMRPEKEDEIRQYIKRGRIIIGPWHILPDFFLVSPESHIRNLLQGERTTRRFGDKMLVGYMPDSFGHIGQMPQILLGFNITSASVWRGLGDEPTEFWWQAPDGSRVLMAYLRDSYSNGSSLPAHNLPGFKELVEQHANSLAPYSISDNLLIMYGTDHMEAPDKTSEAIAYVNDKLSDMQVVHSTLPQYIQALKSSIDTNALKVISGELRANSRSHLLPNVLSTRMWIKQRNQACETLLEKWVEPFSTFADLIENEDPTDRLQHPATLIRQTWRILMENHPHDSICGCSIDQVHDEMKIRFDQVEQVGEELTKQSLVSLATAINSGALTSETAEAVSSVVVFNPTSSGRSDRVISDILLPPDARAFDLIDDKGEIIPFESDGAASTEFANMLFDRKGLRDGMAMINEGRITGLGVQTFSATREENKVLLEITLANAAPVAEVWQHGLEETNAFLEDETITSYHLHARTVAPGRITFIAPQVPALGYRTFWVRPRELSIAPPTKLNPLARALLPIAARFSKTDTVKNLMGSATSEPSQKPPYIIENEYFIVEAITDGTLTLTDKRDGTIRKGLNRFVDMGDRGDEYNFCPPESDSPQLDTKFWGATVTRGAVSQTLELALELIVPVELAEDRASRSEEIISINIVSRITLFPGMERIDIHTDVENDARDHRLRVHFPTGLVDNEDNPLSADFDGHFEIVRRQIGLPEFDESWIEQPRPEVPQRAFTDVSDGVRGLMIANRGLPEVEVIKRNNGATEIAVTLLRCVGWLSRDDFYTRPSHAGPNLETPGAQLPGNWDFDYSIIPHSAGQAQPYQLAYAFETPLRATATALHGGSLTASASFVAVEPGSFVISAIKQTEDGKSWLVRGYNIGAAEASVTMKPWCRFRLAELVNLAEEKMQVLEVALENSITFTARAHEIVTVKFTE